MMFRVGAVLMILSHAADVHGTCSGEECASVEVDETGMIQSTASMMQARRHEYMKDTANDTADAVDLDAVWEQMKGCVYIDQTTEKKKGAHSKVRATLEEQEAALKEAFPACKEIEEMFKGEWEEITNAVSEDQLVAMIEDAKEKGSESLDKFQSALEDMKKLSLDKVEQQVQKCWTKNKLELPDLDELKNNLHDLSSQTRALVDSAIADLTDSNQWKDLLDAKGAA